MMKLTLDHKALMALFAEGGEEFKLALRGAVLKQAAENAGLLAAQEVEEALVKVARLTVQKEVGKITNKWGANPSVKLTKEFQKLLDGKVKLSVERVAYDIAKGIISSEEVESVAKRYADMVMGAIDEKIGRLIASYVNERIERRIQEEVDARLELMKVGDE